MTDEFREDPRAVQPFNLDGLRAGLGITENPTHDEVAAEFSRALTKVDGDLQHGFYAWVTEDDLGHCGTYNKLGNTRFTVLRMLVRGIPIRTQIDGIYQLSGHKISVTVEQDVGDPIVGSNLYLDDRLVASRTSPYDSSGQQAAVFLRSLVEGRGEDPSRLDTTITPKRSPYPFSLKMLRDFSRSQPDQEQINRMFAQMQKSDTVIRKVSEYRLR